ncbi:hypothetical protein AB4Z40_34235 [Bosea sp. 2YAB26]|uniref:hypothetical protein n=1 Tax=Bosea sp. 2YAB26 TaxID=3237478 RepID=UPI003F922F56
MPSFISSSRTVLVTAALALAIYGAAIAAWRPPIHLYPDQDAFNLARAERLLIGEGRPDTVIVGSSLGVRIPDDWLPKDWLNISLGGKGAATGLALLRAASTRPKRVLVEANTLERATDFAFLKETVGPMPLSLRAWLPGFRAEYRPINLLLSIAGGWRSGPNARRAAGDLESACLALQSSSGHDVVADDVVRREVARAVSQPAPPELSQSLAALQPEIASLQAQGVKVLLFVWPTDRELMRAPRAVAIRMAVAKTFPMLRLVSLDAGGLETEDGLHLAPLSARRAACALARAVDS